MTGVEPKAAWDIIGFDNPKTREHVPVLVEREGWGVLAHGQNSIAWGLPLTRHKGCGYDADRPDSSLSWPLFNLA